MWNKRQNAADMTTAQHRWKKKQPSHKELLLLQSGEDGIWSCAVQQTLTMFRRWQYIKQHFCSSVTVSGGTANSGSSAPSATGGDRANSIAKELFRKKMIKKKKKKYSCRNLPALRLRSLWNICRLNWSLGGFKGQRWWKAKTPCACALSQQGLATVPSCLSWQEAVGNFSECCCRTVEWRVLNTPTL